MSLCEVVQCIGGSLMIDAARVEDRYGELVKINLAAALRAANETTAGSKICNACVKSQNFRQVGDALVRVVDEKPEGKMLFVMIS